MVQKYSMITRWIKKFRSGCKNLDDQVRLGRLEIVDSQTVHQAMEAIRRVSGVFGISHSSMVRHGHDLGKIIQNWPIVSHILLKYCKTFDSLG